MQEKIFYFAYSDGAGSSEGSSSLPSAKGTDQPGALDSPLPSLRLVLVYRYF